MISTRFMTCLAVGALYWAVSCLAEMRDAVGDALELIVDGGVRRGTHVLKALALGANACSIGRPYLYGLGAGGQAGVQRALELLRDEVMRGMALLGCRNIDEVTAEKVRGSRFSSPERPEPAIRREIAATRS